MTAYTTGLTVEKELERLVKIPDPAQRAREARRISAVLKQGELDLAYITHECAVELRDSYGLSWPQVAESLGGVSRARAQQIYAS